jgi:protein-S-isoprenylcysteine O-methyltransferase Ste14
MQPAAYRQEGFRFRQKNAAALLASAWCLPAAALAGFLAMRFGAWTVSSSNLLLLGSPAIVQFGRVLLWGWACAVVLERVSLIRLAVLGVFVDLLLLYASRVSFHVNPIFLLAEFFAIGICFLPAQLFARWTHERRHLAARNLMHLCFHSALLLAIWPLLIAEIFGGNWHAWAERSSAANKFYLQFLIFPCVMLITAMQEFHAAGRGTPMPVDAPRRLVTSGIFSYVANPMQLGKFGILSGWGLFWKNPWIVGASLLGLLYSLTIARSNEDRDLSARFGPAWALYRRNVRRWLPRWQPWIGGADAADSAALHLDLDCGPCFRLSRWLAAQRPTQLRILPLTAHPVRTLSRITYRPVGGHREDHGIQAIARAFDHINLAWAFCGWMLRLPLIAWAAELIAAAVSPQLPKHCRTTDAPAPAIAPSVKVHS